MENIDLKFILIIIIFLCSIMGNLSFTVIFVLCLVSAIVFGFLIDIFRFIVKILFIADRGF